VASSLTFSTVLGGNTVTAAISSPDDATVQNTIVTCARALGLDTANTPAAEIATFWMLWAWRKTEAIARQQLEAEKLATVRAEIDAQLGRLG
jgi:hypothetical protein